MAAGADRRLVRDLGAGGEFERILERVFECIFEKSSI